MSLIAGETGGWEVVVGLEIHAQVASEAKLFSGAATAFGAEPNSQVALLDAAMPGTLPVVNERAVEQAVRTGLGLDAEINRVSVFERKNYFYPDLPQGYQISQYRHPVVGAGRIEIDLEDGGTRTVGIARLHLEQDAGKSVHDREPGATLVDLNRAGVALMEIVSEPDLRSAWEAGAFVAKLRSILRFLGTCDGNMEEGSLRADVNVSVRRPGGPLGTRCEIKNVNSIRFVRQAAAFEARRQVAVLEGGGAVAQETRLFDPDRGETRPTRSKEDAEDYRYFPDPDLPPLELDPGWIEEIRRTLPELPDAKKRRFAGEHGLPPETAALLSAERETAAYFEEAARGRDAKAAANWIAGELFGALNRAGLDIARSPVPAARLGALVDLVDAGALSGRGAKEVFEVMFETGGDPAAIMEERGLRQVSDEDAVGAAVDAAIDAAPDQAAQYRAGNEKVLGWFVGQVMKATRGAANPRTVNALLRERLAD